MPTLIRLLILLLVLAGLAFAGMIALTIMVDPGQKEVRVRIPSRDLGVEQTNDPLGLRTAPAPVPDAESPADEPPPEEAATEAAPAGSPSIVELPAPE